MIYGASAFRTRWTHFLVAAGQLAATTLRAKVLSLFLSLTRTAQTFSIYTLAIPFGSNRLEAINIGERERHSGLGARFLTRPGRQATLSSGFEGP